MWSVAQLYRCSNHLRLNTSRLLVTSNNIGRGSKQVITASHCSRNTAGLTKGLKINDLLKRNSILTRLCSTSPKQKPPKIVGYWLLGCSGMVFTAVVLGMVAGYLVLLCSIYYIVRLVVNTTNGSK